MPPATIIGAIIAVAGTVTSAVISSQDADSAKNEARRLANIKRDDNERWNLASEKLSKAKLKLEKREFLFKKEEAKKGRQERALERGIIQREKHDAKMMNLVNSNQVLRSNFLNMFQRR